MKDVDSEQMSGDDDSSYSSVSSIDSDEEVDEDNFEEEDFDSCVIDMIGNRIVPINSLSNIVRKNCCCRRCAVNNHRKYVNDFIQFTKDYDDRIKMEESSMLFGSKLESMNCFQN